MDTLAEVFTTSTVMDLAGPRSYKRGMAYFYEGRIGPSVGGDQQLEVTVVGTVPYVVKLWVDGDESGWSCTCPAAEDGSFCKHCVAVALSLDPMAPPAALLEPARKRPSSMAAARTGRGDAPDLVAWRLCVEDAFLPWGDFISYQEAGRWAADVDEVIDGLENLCDAGHPDAAVALTEHAHRLADAAINYVDDSAGWLTDISLRLIEVHHRACVQGRPDQVELASRLLDMELSTELIGPNRAAATYADVLGAAGLAAYHDLIEPRWRRVKLDGDEYFSRGVFGVHQAMVGWALGTGDPDALIRVHGRGLMLPDEFLEICRALVTAARGDEAIEWARRGLREHVGRLWQLTDLRDFLSAALRERGDLKAAVGLFWDAFSAQPSLSAYRRLLEEADEGSGVDGGWSHRCMEELRARLAEHKAETEAVGRRILPQAATVLVEIMFYEGHREEAWRAATEFGCPPRMWLAMARAREQSHPLDAIAVYEPEVLSRIDRKNNSAYRSAVDLMDRIRRLAGAAGAPDRFTDLLERVRTEHKAKRNLKKMLDQEGW